jgi:alkyl hydroperoxide reductase subunit AhpC
MTLQLGDLAPDFIAATTAGELSLHQYLGEGWGLLFSHPKDFTPVCTTELGTVAKLLPEFEKRSCRVLALSVDSVDDHRRWIEDINETQQTEVTYPIIADEDRNVAHLYGMIHPNADSTLTVRSVFFIGPDKTIKATLTYPASTGRNFDEILRVLDSLQLTALHQVATPANWQHGQDCIIVPSVQDADVPAKFPKGHTVIKPYLRTTPQPDL